VSSLLRKNAKEIWDLAETKGWLEDRSNPIAIYEFKERDITFDDFLKDLLPEPHLFRLALKKVSVPKKETLAKYICGLADKGERKEMLESIKATLEECLQKLEMI
jgi:hypothetical protein